MYGFALGVALFTYVPPIIAGIVLDHRLVGSGGELLLPYLHDVNMMMTLLVSLLALLVIYLRGARLLPDVMNRLTKDGTAVWQQKDADAFIVRWERYYERMNRWSVPIGIVVAAAAIIMNYGFSMQYHGKMWPTAYVDKPQLEYVGVVAFIRPIRLVLFCAFSPGCTDAWRSCDHGELREVGKDFYQSAASGQGRGAQTGGQAKSPEPVDRRDFGSQSWDGVYNHSDTRCRVSGVDRCSSRSCLCDRGSGLCLLAR